ncbi:MAG: hypothetical protein ABW252_04260 [Polyangiales bacterium]
MAPHNNVLAVGMLCIAMGCATTDRVTTPDAPADLGAEADGSDDEVASPSTDAKIDAGTKTGTAAPTATADASAAVGFDYEDETVELTEDLVIPAGKTVRVGPGVTFHAAGKYRVRVLGRLEVEASAAQPSSFTGGGTPSSWHGIVVGKGGVLTLRHAKITGAQYGIFAEAGSDFTVEDTLIDKSFKTAVVYADGTFTRTRFTASVPATIAITEAVAVDDPNGSLTIIDASPTITDSRFDGASIFTDLVRIGGDSQPTFDRVYLHDAHCAFHSSGGTRNGARIRNALMEGFSYAFMTFSTTPIVEDSVFKDNLNDFGLCSGSAANAPKLKNNFYGGEVKLDASCFRIAIKDASPATTANGNAGSSL